MEAAISMELTESGKRAREIDAAIKSVISRVKSAHVAALIMGEPPTALVEVSRRCDALERVCDEGGVGGLLAETHLRNRLRAEDMARQMLHVAPRMPDALWRVYMCPASNVAEPVSEPRATEQEAADDMSRIARVLALAIEASC